MDQPHFREMPTSTKDMNPKIEISMAHALVLAATTGLTLVLLFFWWLRKTASAQLEESSRSFMVDPSQSSDQSSGTLSPRIVAGAPGPRRMPNSRRMRSNRNVAVGRIPATLEQSSQSSSDIETELSDSDAHLSQTPDDSKKKIGVKKQMKLEMKAEKKAAREAMLLEREERKKKQEILDQERRLEEEKQKQEEEAQAEKERLEREEQKRKEHEEYLKLAASFQVEEEGYDPDAQEADSENKLAQFVEYIKDQKVVLLEDLAAQFKMRTKDIIDRIQKLLDTGALVGIVDDRGKFISVTNEELESVAKFIRQRGRVSINDIVVNSNRLINLKPETTGRTE